MNWLAPVVQLLALLVLPIVALSGLLDFLLGRLVPTRPICPRCHGLLSFAALVERAPCPSCAATQDDAPPRVLVRRPHWPGLILFLLASGLAIGAILLLGRLTAAPTVVAMAASAQTMSNQTLILGALRANHPMDGHVTELARRLRLGTCSRGDVRGAIDGLAGAPPGNVATLRRIASLAAVDPTIDHEQRSRWIQSIADRAWPSTPGWAGISSEPPRLSLVDDRTASGEDLLSRVVLLERAELDGAPLSMAPSDRPPILAAAGSSDIGGVPLADGLARGGALVIHGEARYYSRSARELLEFVQFDLPPEAWPEPLARHPVRLEVTLDPRSRP